MPWNLYGTLMLQTVLAWIALTFLLSASITLIRGSLRSPQEREILRASRDIDLQPPPPLPQEINNLRWTKQ